MSQLLRHYLDFGIMTAPEVRSAITENTLRGLCGIYGADFCPCHFRPMSHDIVGPVVHRQIDRYRPIGVLFRYFATHEERLAEFQTRLDAAKHRRKNHA